jgi:2-dehydropantoate 2-reductase
MRRRGIEVRMPSETLVTPVQPLHLCDVAKLRQQFDVVFVLMKAYDTRWAVELIKPHVAADGLVVGVQNGMTVDTIADVMGAARTLGAVIEISSAMWEPGIVERHVPPAASWFALGGIEPSAHARAESVAEILRHAGRVQVTDDIRSAKWMKLVVNAAELVPSAIVAQPMRATVRLPGMRDFMVRAGEEAMAAAVAAGATPMPIFGLEGLKDSDEPRTYVEPLIDAVFDQFALDTTTTTVHQDWSKGRHSEVEEINGLVVREHQRAGQRSPANKVTLEIGLEIERDESKPGLHQLERLVAAL